MKMLPKSISLTSTIFFCPDLKEMRGEKHVSFWRTTFQGVVIASVKALRKEYVQNVQRMARSQ
jgi:hypothetical protein